MVTQFSDGSMVGTYILGTSHSSQREGLFRKGHAVMSGDERTIGALYTDGYSSVWANFSIYPTPTSPTNLNSYKFLPTTPGTYTF